MYMSLLIVVVGVINYNFKRLNVFSWLIIFLIVYNFVYYIWGNFSIISLCYYVVKINII